ncbi:fasciclin domain-containing protein [Maribacter sp. 2307UL18-2]|uniref:fasciclin domain-containing protein n=1 Tax=Maribacter sp. 2307UL18-2 TaxID=3386274 RepID=UPI0039BD439D
MMKKRNKIWAGLLISIILNSACGDSKKNYATVDIEDKTPIASEELSELAPDMTLNDLRSVLGVLEGNTDYDTFYKALKSADMIDKLDNLEDVTIFAPTNEAFNRITETKFAHLKTPDGRKEMRQLLQYHIVVKDEYDFENIVSTIKLNENILRLKTLNGGYIALTIENNEVYITDEIGFQSKITKPDQEAENGVVHGINAVLLAQ